MMDPLQRKKIDFANLSWGGRIGYLTGSCIIELVVLLRVTLAHWYPFSAFFEVSLVIWYILIAMAKTMPSVRRLSLAYVNAGRRVILSNYVSALLLAVAAMQLVFQWHFTTAAICYVAAFMIHFEGIWLSKRADRVRADWSGCAR